MIFQTYSFPSHIATNSYVISATMSISIQNVHHFGMSPINTVIFVEDMQVIEFYTVYTYFIIIVDFIYI